MLISQLSYLTNPIKHRPNYEKRHQLHSSHMGGPGGSMSYVVGSNNSYKPITNTAWVRAQLCKLQKTVHSTRSRK